MKLLLRNTEQIIRINDIDLAAGAIPMSFNY
jgi:hypothetical protein